LIRRGHRFEYFLIKVVDAVIELYAKHHNRHPVDTFPRESMVVVYKNGAVHGTGGAVRTAHCPLRIRASVHAF